jgi:hypothetical protein
MVRCQVNDKLEMVWKEAVVAWLYGTIPAFSWRDWENHEKVSIAGLRTEIWIPALSNTKQEY